MGAAIVPTSSPATCEHLRIKCEVYKHGEATGGPYCKHLGQYIVGGQRGTCVGCEAVVWVEDAEVGDEAWH